MNTYTVKRVADSPREWSSKQGGTFLSYTVDLEDEAAGRVEAGVEWNRKPESKAPQVGDRIAGTIEPGKFSERFKMDYEATKELGSGGPRSGSSGGGNFKSGGGDKDASIARQVALKVCAPRICSDGLTSDVRSLVEEVEKFIAQASAVPPSSPRPALESDQQGVHELLYTLLEKAGEAGPIATLLTDWIVSTQEVAKQDEALAALRDDKRRAKCVAWARAGYEKAHGALPIVSDDGSEIPF